jgi:YesN/AraC family two-component response regulator
VIRVLLADDEVLVRAGVRAILAADPDIEVVAEASDGREALELARVHRPDVALPGTWTESGRTPILHQVSK